MSHTKEPWHVSKLKALPFAVCDETGVVVANCDVAEDYLTSMEAKGNTARVAACVNACANLPDPEKNIRDLVRAANAYLQTPEGDAVHGKARTFLITCLSPHSRKGNDGTLYGAAEGNEAEGKVAFRELPK